MITAQKGSSRHLWSLASFQITRYHNQNKASNIHHIGGIEFRVYKVYRKLHSGNRLVPNVGIPADIIMKTTRIIKSPYLLLFIHQTLIILIFFIWRNTSFDIHSALLDTKQTNKQTNSNTR